MKSVQSQAIPKVGDLDVAISPCQVVMGKNGLTRRGYAQSRRITAAYPGSRNFGILGRGGRCEATELHTPRTASWTRERGYPPEPHPIPPPPTTAPILDKDADEQQPATGNVTRSGRPAGNVPDDAQAAATLDRLHACLRPSWSPPGRPCLCPVSLQVRARLFRASFPIRGRRK